MCKKENELLQGKLEQAMSDAGASIRICKNCGDIMWDGYCIDGGSYYYCSDECLNTEYTTEEFEELYEEAGDNYYSEWYDEEEIFQKIMKNK